MCWLAPELRELCVCAVVWKFPLMCKRCQEALRALLSHRDEHRASPGYGLRASCVFVAGHGSLPNVPLFPGPTLSASSRCGAGAQGGVHFGCVCTSGCGDVLRKVRANLICGCQRHVECCMPS